MRIAVCYDKDTEEVFGHFGATEYFKLYDMDNDTNQITSTEIAGSQGYSHSALIGLLNYFGVDVLLTGGMGGHARDLLDNAGIKYFPGVTGNADEQVAALIAGKLEFDPDASCPHHDHGDDGCCGMHHH